MSEVTFVGVSTSQFRQGKRLSKSLFRQILMQDPWYDNPKVENPDILGWVNYFPSAIFGSGDKKKAGWQTILSIQSWLHILWRTPDGQLRRFFMTNPGKLEEWRSGLNLPIDELKKTTCGRNRQMGINS